MEFLEFIKNFKDKEINKNEFVNVLKNSFDNIIINDKEEFSLIVTLDKNNFQIEYTYNDDNQNITILNYSTIDQIFSSSKL